MAELWEVIHEIKNGKAIEIGNDDDKSYFFLRGGRIWFSKPKLQYEATKMICDLSCPAKVITMPSFLREEIDFLQAMTELKNGRSVMSCTGSVYFFDKEKKMVCFESIGAVADIRGDEVAGKWIAFN